MTESKARPSRRRFLLIGGAAAVSLAAAGGVWAFTRTPVAALEPWREDALARSDDPRMRALAHAMLCPNPHNRQPWLIDFDPDGETMIYAEPTRLLPVTDPYSRQIVIGFGCFLEMLAIASSVEGLHADITPFPDGADPKTLDARPIARVRFVDAKGAAADPLAAQIRNRRTVREPYDMARLPSADALAAIRDAARGPGLTAVTASDTATMAPIRDLMWRAHERESLTPAAMGESIDLMRIGRAEIEANPDGISLSGAFFEGLSKLGMLSRDTLRDPESDNFRLGMEIYKELCDATPGAFWILSDTTGRLTEIATGRAYVRAHLTATMHGLAFQPMSQALQEYVEMADLYDHARALFNVPADGAVQMLARVGHAPDTAPSPRWPIESRLLS